MNTPTRQPAKEITIHKGKYSHESTLTLKGCECERLLERANELLADYARLMSHGEEFAKIRDHFQACQTYFDEATRVCETGEDWREPSVLPVIRQYVESNRMKAEKANRA